MGASRGCTDPIHKLQAFDLGIVDAFMHTQALNLLHNAKTQAMEELEL